jgi:hypothetical protein
VRGGAGRRLTRTAEVSAPARAAPEDRLEVTASVRVDGDSPASGLDSAAFTLAAVHHPSGTWVDLPLSVRRDGDRFALTASFPLAQALSTAPEGAPMQLRLRLVWENSSWQTFLERPPGAEGAEVFYAADGLLQLQAVGTGRPGRSTG